MNWYFGAKQNYNGYSSSVFSKTIFLDINIDNVVRNDKIIDKCDMYTIQLKAKYEQSKHYWIIIQCIYWTFHLVEISKCPEINLKV